MAKAKKTDKVEKSLKANFIGGPKDGTSLQIVNPPPVHIRLAFPEWCTYEWDTDLKAYRYIGDVKIIEERGIT